MNADYPLVSNDADHHIFYRLAAADRDLQPFDHTQAYIPHVTVGSRLVVVESFASSIPPPGPLSPSAGSLADVAVAERVQHNP